MKNLIAKSSKALGAFLFTLVAVFTVACIMPNNDSTTKVEAAAKISKSSVTLPIGSSEQLKVNGTSKKATWKTTDKKVATVTNNGKVTAKKAGSAKIQAKVGSKTYTCKVKVLNFKLNHKSVTMTSGKTTTLKVSGTKSKVTYKTSNKKIATVTSKGVVKGVKKGSTNIKVKVGKDTYTLPVKVEAPSISKSSISLKKGNTYTLKLNGTNRNVSWSTNNSKVATVSKGKVTAKAVGQAIITAKVNDKSYTCKVVVGHNVINCPDSITVKYGETKTYILTATDGFEYGYHNSSIADVSINPSLFYAGDKLTMKITGNMVGTTTLKLVSKAGWTKNVKITVVGNKIATGTVGSTISNIKVNSLVAYKSANSSYDIMVQCSFTNNISEKLLGYNVEFGFYDKNGKLVESEKKGITNSTKGKAYAAYFINYGYGSNTMKDVTSVKIISIQPVLDKTVVGQIRTNPTTTVISDTSKVNGITVSNIQKQFNYGSYYNETYGQFAFSIKNNSNDTKYINAWFDAYDSAGKKIGQSNKFNYEFIAISGGEIKTIVCDPYCFVGGFSTGTIAKVVLRFEND
ncbi:MAG: Ig-like domain-containing protein [bacterium]|nr:Ig-like domain-containing protein [bacterium]